MSLQGEAIAVFQTGFNTSTDIPGISVFILLGHGHDKDRFIALRSGDQLRHAGLLIRACGQTVLLINFTVSQDIFVGVDIRHQLRM